MSIRHPALARFGKNVRLKREAVGLSQDSSPRKRISIAHTSAASNAAFAIRRFLVPREWLPRCGFRSRSFSTAYQSEAAASQQTRGSPRAARIPRASVSIYRPFLRHWRISRAFERARCECVFSSEWDKHAQVTYEANFGEKPHGDIHSIAVADIPKHDILCAGFP